MLHTTVIGVRWCNGPILSLIWSLLKEVEAKIRNRNLETVIQRILFEA